jgi:hypothetical protein
LSATQSPRRAPKHCARDIETYAEQHWGDRADFTRAKPLTHSGYRNFETFCVANYVSGNYDGEATYTAARAIVAECVGDDYAAERELRQWVENRLPEIDGVAADLLAGAVEEVDWSAILRHVRAE